MIIISNTSPISNLAAIGQLTLLQQLYGNIIIPPAVYQEILASGTTDPGTLALQTLDWIEVIPVTNDIFLKRFLKRVLLETDDSAKISPVDIDIADLTDSEIRREWQNIVAIEDIISKSIKKIN